MIQQTFPFIDDIDYTPIKPEENPFDRELDSALELLVEDDYPLHWSSTEGEEK